MKKSQLEKIIREYIIEIRENENNNPSMLNEMPGCNPPMMSGGEGNNCGVAGSNYDCANGTGGTLQSVMGFCLCVAPGGGTIQGGIDDFCDQGPNDMTTGGGVSPYLSLDKEKAQCEGNCKKGRLVGCPPCKHRGMNKFPSVRRKS